MAKRCCGRDSIDCPCTPSCKLVPSGREHGSEDCMHHQSSISLATVLFIPIVYATQWNICTDLLTLVSNRQTHLLPQGVRPTLTRERFECLDTEARNAANCMSANSLAFCRKSGEFLFIGTAEVGSMEVGFANRGRGGFQ